MNALVQARKSAGVHRGSFSGSAVQSGDYVSIAGDKPSGSSKLIGFRTSRPWPRTLPIP